VYYPGLPSDPFHEIAKKQMRGFGGMVSFNFVSGKKEDAIDFLKNKIYPRRIFRWSRVTGKLFGNDGTHRFDKRKEIGITDDLVRLSVGIEDADDLIDDLKEH
jgi:cystathionine beta-lyase